MTVGTTTDLSSPWQHHLFPYEPLYSPVISRLIFQSLVKCHRRMQVNGHLVRPSLQLLNRSNVPERGLEGNKTPWICVRKC